MSFRSWILIVTILSLSGTALAAMYVTEADLQKYSLKPAARGKSRSIDETTLKKRAVDALLEKLNACGTKPNPMTCAKQAIKDSDLDIPANAEIGEWKTEVQPASANPKTGGQRN